MPWLSYQVDQDLEGKRCHWTGALPRRLDVNSDPQPGIGGEGRSRSIVIPPIIDLGYPALDEEGRQELHELEELGNDGDSSQDDETANYTAQRDDTFRELALYG